MPNSIYLIMENVYLLWFTCVDKRLSGEQEFLIGVYSSVQNAEAAQKRKEQQNGFKDYKECFEICEYSIDEDAWKEGFSIV